MSKHDDGGPAFPYDGEVCQGMTLEDHYAGLAMQGFFGSPVAVAAAGESAEKSGMRLEDVIAINAYEYAAAMIAEKRRREKQ